VKYITANNISLINQCTMKISWFKDTGKNKVSDFRIGNFKDF